MSRHEVIIVGAGFGGLGCAIRLKQSGFDDFVILEKGADVGGVWRENTYPGAACDIRSHLYSYSFEQDPDWSCNFAPQAEILAYLQRCARKYAIQPHLRLGTEVAAAEYDDARAQWSVTTTDGRLFTARSVIMSCGQLSQPSTPRLRGADDYTGVRFHSAEWRHDCDLADRRIAVIGTGASAIQFVPEIAPRAARLTIFQRSAPYVIPRPRHRYRQWQRDAFRRWPWLLRASRAGIFLYQETLGLGFAGHRSVLQQVAGIHRRNLERHIRNPELRRKLTPDYPLGCKRLLVSSEWYPALARTNVDVVCERIDSMTPRGIVTSDGLEREFDVIIYGTGFAATEFLAPIRIRGRQGRDLESVWRDGAEAYLGTTVAGFPNFFVLYGPNTNLGHNSIVYMLESQYTYVLQCLEALRQPGVRSLDVRADVQSGFNQELISALHGTVWDEGCTSWYKTADGRNTNNWPGHPLAFRRRTRRLNPSDYVLER